MQRVLIDASAWTQALRTRGDTSTRDRVRAHVIAGTAAWCDVTRVEIWAGVRGAAERDAIKTLEKSIARVPLTPAIWDLAVELAIVAQRSGLHFPGPDLAVFACARLSGLPLLHRDNHFDLLANLKV